MEIDPSELAAINREKISEQSIRLREHAVRRTNQYHNQAAGQRGMWESDNREDYLSCVPYSDWQSYSQMVRTSIRLAKSCPTVISVENKLVSYALGDSFEVELIRREEPCVDFDSDSIGEEIEQELLCLIKEITNEFLDLEMQETMLRSRHDVGEVVVTEDPHEPGKLWKPEWYELGLPTRLESLNEIEIPGFDADQTRSVLEKSKFGVILGKSWEPVGYIFDATGPHVDSGPYVAEADRVVHAKLTDVGKAPRGCSAWWSVECHCDRVSDMGLAGASMVLVQAANAVIVQLPKEMTPAQAHELATKKKKQVEQSGGAPPQPGVNYIKGEVQNNPLQIGAADIERLMALDERKIASIVDVAEFLATGDSGSGNRANFSEAKEPLLIRVRKEQKTQSKINEKVIWLGIRIKRQLTDAQIEALQAVFEIRTTYPELALDGLGGVVATGLPLYDRKLWSAETLVKKTGEDYLVEQQRIREESANENEPRRTEGQSTAPRRRLRPKRSAVSLSKLRESLKRPNEEGDEIESPGSNKRTPQS